MGKLCDLTSMLVSLSSNHILTLLPVSPLVHAVISTDLHKLLRNVYVFILDPTLKQQSDAKN